jgi:hypothetical protein
MGTMSFAKFSGRGASAAKAEEDASAARRVMRGRFMTARTYGREGEILSFETNYVVLAMTKPKFRMVNESRMTH